MTPLPPPAGRATRQRSRLLATAGVLLGAGLVVLCAGRPWAQAAITGLPGGGRISADGRDVAPAASALALVAAAGAVVLATAGRWVRLVVSALLVLAGLGVLAVSLSVLGDPAAALVPATARVTGTLARPPQGTVHVTAWPIVSAVGGLLVALGGLLGLARGARWSGPSRRYERAGGLPNPGHGPVRGSVGGGPAGGGQPGGGTDEPVEPPVATGKDDRLDAWDRLSEGVDPTE